MVDTPFQFSALVLAICYARTDRTDTVLCFQHLIGLLSSDTELSGHPLVDPSQLRTKGAFRFETMLPAMMTFLVGHRLPAMKSYGLSASTSAQRN